LPEFFAGRRADPDWRGCNVTVPHKQAIIPLLDELTPLAEAVGAVNLVVPRDGRLLGGNTDVEGIVNAIAPVSPGQLETVCLIGSGGAALAALAAFRLLGVRQLLLNVRNQEKGAALLAASGFAGRVGPVDDQANLTGANLVVNASTLGMTGKDAMPASVLAAVESIRDRSTIVFDMVYAPLETALLAAARGAGLHVVDGLSMLIGQAAAGFTGFFGCDPPRDRDRELRQLLMSRS
jgi:shikimate dehydrogenase